jgi:hypothetical protein
MQRQRPYVERGHHVNVRFDLKTDRQGIGESPLLNQDEETNRHTSSLQYLQWPA